MKKIVSYSLLFFILGCYASGQTEYEKLNSLPVQSAVFETKDIVNDSTRYDTADVYIQNGNFMTTYLNDLNEGEKMMIFQFYEPYKIAEDGDSILRQTFLNYDLLGDTIRYLEKSEWPLGKTKTFEINGTQYKVLKQPRWTFTKSAKPDIYEFYTNKFGLILRLLQSQSEFINTKLIELSEQKGNVDLEKLIEVIEADKDFCTMTH